MDSWDADTQKSDISSFEATDKRIDCDGYGKAPTAGVSARFNTKANEVLKVKIAVSYTSIENAWENLNQDCNHWDFDKVREEARNEWNAWLNKIEVKGGTRDQRVKFYTDLWHVLLGRHKLNDYSGDYPDYTHGKRDGVRSVGDLKVRDVT